MKDVIKTKVIFRIYPEGDVIALMPEERHNDALCMSYQRIGQHGGADYSFCVSATKAAKPSEYTALKKEMEGLGYNLDVKKRHYMKRGKV